MKRVAGLLLISAVLMNACTDAGVFLSRRQGSRSLSTEYSPPVFLTGSVESRLRLLSREFVANTLELTFGPSVATVIDSMIRANSSYFGGPCDFYRGDCVSYGESQRPQVPVGTSGRYGYMTRACDLIAKTDTAVLFAARLALGDPALAMAGVPSPSAAAIDSAFRLFYQDRASVPEVDAELAALVSDALVYGPFEQWRYLLLTLCLSPGWQIL